jgi:hypothetical protein
MIAMQVDQPTVNAAPVELLNPPYWLVSATEWPCNGPLAEAAVAIAPAAVSRHIVSDDARQILGCADLYARKHSLRVVFFSDLTRMFTQAGTSWARLGVDWEKALQDLGGGQFPTLLLTISERVYVVISDPAVRPAPAFTGDEQSLDDERELVRTAIARQLVGDWTPYVQSAAEAGRLRLA